MEISLRGRSAIITGGSKGLGLAMAIEFGRSGADVAILARGQEALDKAADEIKTVSRGKTVAISCDVADAASLTKAYDSAMMSLSKIDILVNNAGMSSAGPLDTLSDQDWQRDLDLKLFAAIRLCRLAFPQMRERKWGRIINVLNIGAKAPRANGAPTVVSRAAGLALTKVLAGEGAPHNILVNALMVGVIESDQWHRASTATGKPLPELLAGMGRNVPLGRVGRAEEFANIATFLASDAASYIAGTAINVDGGMSPVP